ncbi:MAG: tRNA (N6-isopentenyl adenosine(37)-C2)-methylthiotransferase MiaB, partial [Eggerthellaceae bacterium]|nr:tRNA (N6-isopentenyl adenosine(37)-C2)-methylthiotransferase MiaB [Eggerthellaceae bacterium]
MIDFSALTYHVVTFGCQMNEHDSERIEGMLSAAGAVSVQSIEDADIVVFVTCCVREAADVRAMGQIASLKNIPLRVDSPLSKRIVCMGGCVGQRDGFKIQEKQKHVDVVFGTFNIASLLSLISETIEKHQRQCSLEDKQQSVFYDLPIKRKVDHAAWIPINSGCNNFCTYCIVPYVRGRETSRPMEDIVNEAKRYV